jgi:hypothetical protein
MRCCHSRRWSTSVWRSRTRARSSSRYSGGIHDSGSARPSAAHANGARRRDRSWLASWSRDAPPFPPARRDEHSRRSPGTPRPRSATPSKSLHTRQDRPRPAHAISVNSMPSGLPRDAGIPRSRPKLRRVLSTVDGIWLTLGRRFRGRAPRARIAAIRPRSCCSPPLCTLCPGERTRCCSTGWRPKAVRLGRRRRTQVSCRRD